ncbi:uncharacterized protein C2orf73 homolog [Dendronephthya gigantea]|uniref:uncharacterized protein C2orf73 homolog n=1 Tax=Dendronephthya gigantea TaxID=151771 RepID=UPI00106D5FE2|nr:uncharacterized protein C2orf73 homolog [Dendronephthya gigantea]
MAIYLPPISRKKKVERAVINSKAKLFSADIRDPTTSTQSIYQQDFLKHTTPPAELRITSPGRRNKPQPTSVTFNWKNSRSLCEPVCCVATESVRTKQAEWWPNKIPKDEKPHPSYSLDSTSRSDYKPIDIAEYVKMCQKQTKQLIETRKAQATGREKISYEHKYNSRLPKNQPDRGKLHGSFINGEIFT